MGTIPRFNNELEGGEKLCGEAGRGLGAAGDLDSQIKSEHLVIVAQQGSKITFLPTLPTSNSLKRGGGADI